MDYGPWVGLATHGHVAPHHTSSRCPTSPRHVRVVCARACADFCFYFSLVFCYDFLGFFVEFDPIKRDLISCNLCTLADSRGFVTTNSVRTGINTALSHPFSIHEITISIRVSHTLSLRHICNTLLSEKRFFFFFFF